MEQDQVRLTLSAADAGLLAEVLAAHTTEMRRELTRTDDRRYRTELRERLDRLEAIAARLSENLSPVAVPPPEVRASSPRD